MEDGKQVFGFLEFNKFYNERLKNDEEFKDARIPYEKTENLLSIDVENLTSVQRWDTLVHKENIKEILRAGARYD